MASRIIHLAVAKEIMKSEAIADSGRFLLGSIIPDAKVDSALRAAPHYQTVLPSGLITYELGRFRREYGNKMATDELYLAYYLHLIQDMVYRRYMYALPHWDARMPENIVKLHSDYRKINRYIIESRALVNSIALPGDFCLEEIVRRFDFDMERFMSELQGDFEKVQEGNYHFFNPQMADEYITLATDACLRELDAMRKGQPLCDEYAMAWGKE